MMYLGERLRTLEGQVHTMAGVLPLETEMTEMLVHFGYVESSFCSIRLSARNGTVLRGHSFHCSRIVAHDSRSLRASGTCTRFPASIPRKVSRHGNVFASYIHLHFRPSIPSRRFVATAELAARFGGGAMRRLLVYCSPVPSLACASPSNTDGRARRTVVVPDHPHELVCLHPSVVDDRVFSLARIRTCRYQDFTTIPLKQPEEAIIGAPLNPSSKRSLRCAQIWCSASGDLNSGFLRNLQCLGIPVFMVNPHGIAGIHKSIFSLGHALNREADAGALLHDLQERERRRVAGKPRFERLFTARLVRPYYDHWQDMLSLRELIESRGRKLNHQRHCAGMAASQSGSHSRRQPDAIAPDQRFQASIAELFKNRPGWQALSSCSRTASRIYVDKLIELPSPAAIYAMEDLAKQLHP